MKIKKNDKIRVITGKERGKVGNVLKILAETNRVVVKGINVAKKHVKASGKEPGGIIEMERPFSLSNVMLVCPKCKQPTRVGYRFEGKKKVRFCKKCDTTV